MSNRSIITSIVLVPFLIIGFSFTGNQHDAELRSKKAVGYFSADVDSLLICAKQLQKAAEQPTASVEELKKHFAASRKAFKQTEVITAYFFPATEQMLNSPPIPEADEEEGTQLIRTPEGLQHIGELIYADTLSGENKNDLLLSCRRFTASCFRLKQLSASAAFTDWQLMEALRFEVIRIYSLGLTGFDTPEYPLALSDAKTAAESVQKYAMLFSTSLSEKNRKLEKSYRAALTAFVKSIPQNKDADDFDRLSFIRSKANPLSVQFTKAAKVLGLTPQIATSAMRWEAATPFERGAIDPWFYARSNRSEYKRKEVAELGRILFFEPLLSGNGLRSCASCHQPGKSFTDGQPQSTAFTGNGTVLRNSPSLLNAALQPAYFYDSRVNSLEDQARLVVANNIELHGDIAAAAEILRESDEYRMLFRKAFSGTEDTLISPKSIFIAIAAFERTLLAQDAPFYKYMRNETTAYSEEAKQGFNLFTGKAACATCHFLPYFGGIIPPLYSKGEVEIIGVPATPDTTNTTIDSDEGRMRVNGMQLHRYAFKTPMLTNIAETAPYMHNGVYKTMEEVIDFYNKGGGTGLNIAPQNQTLPPDKLELTASEKTAIIAFLKTLTDTSIKITAPEKLPTFNHPERNTRKPGGVY